MNARACKGCRYFVKHYGNKDSQGKRTVSNYWCVAKNGCVYRTEDSKCEFYSDYGKGVVSYCDFDDCEEKKPSNADRIRAMTDEELASFLYHLWDNSSWCNGCCDEECSCEPCWLDWLKQEAEDG